MQWAVSDQLSGPSSHPPPLQELWRWSELRNPWADHPLNPLCWWAFLSMKCSYTFHRSLTITSYWQWQNIHLPFTTLCPSFWVLSILWKYYSFCFLAYVNSSLLSCHWVGHCLRHSWHNNGLGIGPVWLIRWWGSALCRHKWYKGQRSIGLPPYRT